MSTPPLELAAPTSKSMTQRALVIAALSDGPVRIDQPLDCDDSVHLTGLLRELGCTVSWHDDHAIVEPTSLVGRGQTIFCGNAGTAVRFGACLSLLCNGGFAIDGNTHMRKRPLGPLGTSLTTLGIAVEFLGSNGCPPVRLQRDGEGAHRVSIDASLSSQYASGLAMVAPRLPRGMHIELTGKVVSQPYLTMTTTMMQRAGANVDWDGSSIIVAPSSYRAETITVEPDWSGAAFLLAAGFIVEREITVPGLLCGSESLQGDAVFADMLTELDRDRPHEFDLTDAPDLIAPLAAAALFAANPSQIRGAAHTRVKECDRLAVLCGELSRVGAKVVEHPDGMDIAPFPLPETTSTPEITLDPADDHRMAMAFGLVSLRLPHLKIDRPDCVSKSFPQFWRVLDMIRQP